MTKYDGVVYFSIIKLMFVYTAYNTIDNLNLGAKGGGKPNSRRLSKRGDIDKKQHAIYIGGLEVRLVE